MKSMLKRLVLIVENLEIGLVVVLLFFSMLFATDKVFIQLIRWMSIDVYLRKGMCKMMMKYLSKKKRRRGTKMCGCRARISFKYYSNCGVKYYVVHQFSLTKVCELFSIDISVYFGICCISCWLSYIGCWHVKYLLFIQTYIGYWHVICLQVLKKMTNYRLVTRVMDVTLVYINVLLGIKNIWLLWIICLRVLVLKFLLMTLLDRRQLIKMIQSWTYTVLLYLKK